MPKQPWEKPLGELVGDIGQRHAAWVERMKREHPLKIIHCPVEARRRDGVIELPYGMIIDNSAYSDSRVRLERDYMERKRARKLGRPRKDAKPAL